MKKEFLNFVNALIAAAPETAEQLMTENVKAYLETLTDTKNEKPELTDNGKLILNYLQTSDAKTFKSKDVADALFVSSRKVSGGMRKLVADNFVDKIGEDPAVYALTEKGRNYKIED